ncbi:MAG: thiamine pyrophosphate-binding protein [Acidobacteria bacterium]|nr:thiamine pyrophosphate-binding protein [Acidobacteriota bacterium]
MDKTLSDVIIRYLELLGVEFVFSVPGSPLGPLYDALVRSERRGGPRTVLARHEGGAAFMADGYARETGRIGVCCATTGPGATNLITGVACAYADHIPMLVITPQTPLPTFGLGPFQESSADAVDIVGMFEHCTRYSSLVSHPEQLEKKLAAALTVALQTPKGPAHLSVPVEILRASAGGGGEIAFPDLHKLATESVSLIDNTGVEALCRDLFRTLSRGRKVVLLIGHDCAGSTDELTGFAELIHAPMITTQRGKSRIDPYHPLARGVFGFAGHITAREALTDECVGLILAAGTDLGEWATGGWDPALMNNKLVHIHNTMDCFSRSPMAQLHVYGTISTIFRHLAERIQAAIQEGKLAIGMVKGQEAAADQYLEYQQYVPRFIKVQDPDSCKLTNSSPVLKPQRVIRELAQRFPAETRFLIDNSNSVPWSIHYFFNRHPKHYHLSVGFASMGWAIGAAVGMALGAGNAPVICLTGDGCFLMNGLEISVAVEQNLPVIFAVLIDRAYGMIKHSLRRTSDEHVDLAIPPIDFCKMAEAAGADAFAIRRPEDFEKLDCRALCNRKGPTLLEIHIDPEEVPPLRMA